MAKVATSEVARLNSRIAQWNLSGTLKTGYLPLEPEGSSALKLSESLSLILKIGILIEVGVFVLGIMGLLGYFLFYFLCWLVIGFPLIIIIPKIGLLIIFAKLERLPTWISCHWIFALWHHMICGDSGCLTLVIQIVLFGKPCGELGHVVFVLVTLVLEVTVTICIHFYYK
jgi:hypothetical protein